MTLINLTPHAIVVVQGNGSNIATLAPSGTAARVAMLRRTLSAVMVSAELVPIVAVTPGAVEGLPEPRDGVLYIVSTLVANAATDRTDLVSPDALVRDGVGAVIGCAAFAAGAGMARALGG